MADLMRAMGHEVIGRVLVCVHTARDPGDQEWGRYLERVRQVPERSQGVFVYTAGGAPGSKQRKALFEAMAGRAMRVAVVSPSRVALAIGIAVSWFQPDLKTFSPAHLADALAHLKLDSHDAESVLRAARGIAQELGLMQAAIDLATGSKRRAG